MARPRDDRQRDLFRPALEAIIDMGHPLVRLAGKIDWDFLDRRLGEVYAPGDGQPPLPIGWWRGCSSSNTSTRQWLAIPFLAYFLDAFRSAPNSQQPLFSEAKSSSRTTI